MDRTGRLFDLWVLFEDAVDSLAKLVGVYSFQIEGSLSVEISITGESGVVLPQKCLLKENGIVAKPRM